MFQKCIATRQCVAKFYLCVHQSRGGFFHFKAPSVFGAVTVVLNLCHFVYVVGMFL